MDTKQNVLVLFLRWIVAIVFIYAGVVKIINPSSFAEAIDNYRILPYFLVTLTAATLPWIELICGLLLIFGKWIRGSSLILILLNLVFLFAIGSALARGLDISCGCFSETGEGAKVGIARLGEDFILLMATAFIYMKNILRDAQN